jgi:hypothetical protein
VLRATPIPRLPRHNHQYEEDRGRNTIITRSVLPDASDVEDCVACSAVLRYFVVMTSLYRDSVGLTTFRVMLGSINAN